MNERDLIERMLHSLRVAQTYVGPEDYLTQLAAALDRAKISCTIRDAEAYLATPSTPAAQSWGHHHYLIEMVEELVEEGLRPRLSPEDVTSIRNEDF